MEEAAVAMEEQTAVRLYVGGLGERVTEEDIRKTFNNLGTLHSVDIIRTKGRSFAYMNFLPSSHKSLAKLFSTYNGCSWKGGKLKLEKAKEHYIDRLKREWAEEAELKNTSHGDVDVNMVDVMEPQTTLDLKDMHIGVFFPKLRKVKPLPLSGTGKHKYSFRRLDAPPHPVHFCDCPEHAVPDQPLTVPHANGSGIQKGGINKGVYNMKNSVKNRFLRREPSSDCREAAVHDSIIQDSGINEEEINIMDSVMKKLLDRGTSKKDPENFQPLKQKAVVTSEVQKEINDIDEGRDDGDIKINAAAVQNFSSFSSRTRERQTSLPNVEIVPDEETIDMDDESDGDDIQINTVAGGRKRQTSLANEIITRLNEQRNHDDLARQSKPGILNQKAESSNKKRKSEEHATIKNQSEPETKKSSIKDMWSRKSAWKQLVGDGSSSSFTLSQITPGNDTNQEEPPTLGISVSSDTKKSKLVRKVVHEKPTGSEEHEENNFMQEDSQSSQRQKKTKKVRRAAQKEPKSSRDGTPTGSEEHEEANKYVQLDGPSSQHDEEVEPPASQPTGATAGSDKVTEGSSWLQRSTWTQLVGGDNSSSFSISQILSGDLLQKQSSHKPDDFSTVNAIPSGAFFKEQRSEAMSDGSGAIELSSDVSNTRKDTQVPTSHRDVNAGQPSKGTDLSDSPTNKILESEPKRTPSYTGVKISESGPFVRNADSVKEWMAAKAAVSKTLKKLKKK